MIEIGLAILAVIVVATNAIVYSHSMKRGERFEAELLRLELFRVKIETAVNNMARMTAISVHKAGIKDSTLPSPQQRAISLVMRMERVGGRSGEDKREYVVESLQRHFPSLSVAAADAIIATALKAIQRKAV